MIDSPTPSPRRGIETTEFLMSFALLVVGAFLALRAEQPETQELGRQLCLVAGAAYPVSRGLAKMGGGA